MTAGTSSGSGGAVAMPGTGGSQSMTEPDGTDADAGASRRAMAEHPWTPARPRTAVNAMRQSKQCDQIPPSSMDCAKPLAPGDARKCTIGVGPNQRSYYWYAPATYNPCKPMALVIDCHGAMETAEAQAGIVTLHTASR